MYNRYRVRVDEGSGFGWTGWYSSRRAAIKAVYSSLRKGGDGWAGWVVDTTLPEPDSWVDHWRNYYSGEFARTRPTRLA